MTYDALVLGAGPAGSTIANLLARAGWSTAIVERAVFPRRKVCGEFVSATNLPLLEELGVGTDFHDTAGPRIKRVGLYTGDVSLEAGMPELTAAVEGWGRALRREKLDRLLLDAAARRGVAVWQPYKAVGLESSRGVYSCRLMGGNDERVLRARLLVDARGSWNSGDTMLPSTRARRPGDLLAFKAHFADAALPPDLMPLLAFPGGYGGMVTSDAGRVCLSCCIRRDALARCRAAFPNFPAGAAVLEHIRSSCWGVHEVLEDRRRVEAWLARGPVRPGLFGGYRQGVFRVGSAAGEPHPIIAEGISVALQSSKLLAQVLTSGWRSTDRPDFARAGAAYERALRGHFAGRIRTSSLFARLATSGQAALLLTPLLRRFPMLLSAGARLSGKIDDTYLRRKRVGSRCD
jgi:flavin-dependent dehydrogenase